MWLCYYDRNLISEGKSSTVIYIRNNSIEKEKEKEGLLPHFKGSQDK